MALSRDFTGRTDHFAAPARCTIVPPYMLERLADSEDPEVAARAQASLRVDEQVRQARRGSVEARDASAGRTSPDAARPSARATARPHEVPGDSGRPGATEEATEAGPDRLISDAGGEQTLPGAKVRGEGEPATGDPAADEAYDGLGATWELWSAAYGRNSLDGKGMRLLGTVHYGQGYDNAFWDGTQMVFGDGDGKVFERFTKSLDVIGHELAHGVTEHTAGLLYQGQSGALNESISDVFGVLVVQHSQNQTADQADWLIGADLLAPGIKGRALRDMREPGTAYDDPQLGKDPQPGHMDDYVNTTDDHGGVHINSGIPNRAFVLAALEIGGHAWEDAGAIWYAAVSGDAIRADCDFVTFANLTIAAAEAAHGADSNQTAAVRNAWEQVGVLNGAGGSASGGDTEPAPSTDQPSDPEGDNSGDAPTDTPSDRDKVQLRRTGGLAGLTRERTVALGDLPAHEASAWRSLLASPTLRTIAAAPARVYPDGFNSTVKCRPAGLDVSIPEPSLPDNIRTLFENTLEGSDDD